MDLEFGFRLEDWAVAPRQGTLTKGEEVIHLEPKVMGVLVCLARHAGDVVKRDELLAEVWPNVVVQEEVLSRSISLLRSSFKDERREPRFIQTVTRVGYCLVAPVRPISEPPSKTRNVALPVAVGAALTVAIVVIVFLSLEDVVPQWRPGSDVVSIAVLPFVDRSDGDDPGNFSAGLTDEIMSDLSRVDDLRVIFRAGNPDEDACVLGKKLDATTLLRGFLRRDGERLKVTVRWVNASDCYQIWSETYDRRLDDIFEVQQAISEAIVNRLASALGKDLASINPAGPAPLPEAYQPFLLGRHNLVVGRYDLMRRGEESIRRSIKLFKDAIQRDPDLADAHLGLAEAYIVLPSYILADDMPQSDKDELLNLAVAALTRVVELDGSPVRTYAASAFIHSLQMEWIKAEEMFQSAIALQPNDAHLRFWYSQFLAKVGYLDRSLEQAELASYLNDVSPLIRHRLAVAYLWVGRTELAAEQFRLARNSVIEPAIIPEPDLILFYRQKRFAEMTQLIFAIQKGKELPTTWVAAVIEALQHPDDVAANRLGTAALTQAAEAGEIPPRLAWGALILMRQDQLALAKTNDLMQNQRRYIADLMEFLFVAETAAVRANNLFPGFIEQVQLDRFWDLHGWPQACTRIDGRISCH